MRTRRWGEFLLHLRWGPDRPAGSTPTDGALLRRFGDGRDEAAFALLVQRHGPTVFGVCCRILGPGSDAEAAFQATFVILARKAAALADRAVVGNWLFGVARRTALKARARAARRRAKERAMARPESHPPTHAGELREAIDAAVAGLPAKYRAPVVLCEIEGRSLREAAAELGWPEGTVADQLLGAGGNDILIDGTVALVNPATDSLTRVLADYRPANRPSLIAISARVGVTFDVAGSDTLTGAGGTDWFWSDDALDVLDRTGAEPKNAQA